MRIYFTANDNYSNIFQDRDKNKTWSQLLMQFCNYKFFIFTRRLFLIYPEVSFVVLVNEIPLATRNQPGSKYALIRCKPCYRVRVGHKRGIPDLNQSSCMLAIANNCTKIFVIAVDFEIMNKHLVFSLINELILCQCTNTIVKLVVQLLGAKSSWENNSLIFTFFLVTSLLKRQVSQ